MPEGFGDQNRDIEGRDVALAGLAVEVLGGQEVQQVGVVNGDGRHPGATPGSALAHHPQHRGVHIAQGCNGAGFFGPKVGPLKEVIENLYQETHRAAAGATTASDGRPLRPQTAKVHMGFLALYSQTQSRFSSLDNAAHIIGHDQRIAGLFPHRHHPVAPGQRRELGL